ncbi:MAG: hypothetical protein GY851_20315 [bacterium]|nr:hypothetical protein [bacterium]
MNAGTARIDITPDRAICLAGYSARTGHSQGVYHALFVKVLVIEEAGERAAIITSDLIGFDRDTCEAVKKAVEASAGLPADRVLLSASHTHTGPEIRLKGHKYVDAFDEEYARGLVDKIAGTAAHAVSRLEPVTVSLAEGSCMVGVNRRLATPEGVAMRPSPAGVMDPEVTALRVSREDGTVLAVLMNYACHPTTLGDYLVGADYPGYAQDAVEAEFPGSIAMFIQGCGADIKVRHVDGKGFFKSGPHSVAKSLGDELARAVLLALGSGDAQPVEGPIATRLDEIELPLQIPPTQAEVDEMKSSEDRFLKAWAEEMGGILAEGGEFMSHRTMTVQTLTIGDFALVGLSGEICVGYALRLKKELAGRPLIVAGYTNGMIGYIPTEAMMPEGGYEVNKSHYYDMMPGPYAPEVEEAVCAKVHELLG